MLLYLMSEFTPLMKQYFSIKERYKEEILFFRVGDFYEMFGEDAKIASSILQIALTTRDKDKDDPIPMCGIPYFARDTYISKLIKAGYRVAICEQLQDPEEAKGIVERDVVRVVTASTHTPEDVRENSYIMSFLSYGKGYGIAIADIHVGEFIIYETHGDIEDEIARFMPKEILYPQSLRDNIGYSGLLKKHYSTPYEDWYFDYTEAYKELLRFFKVSSLEGYGCENMHGGISAGGALIHYLSETQKDLLSFKKITIFYQKDYLLMDAFTIRNLELVENMRDGSTNGTLLKVMDETLTPMGGRLLRHSIVRPLFDLNEINNRLDAISELINSDEVLDALRNILRKIQDIERINIRLMGNSVTPRELIALKSSLKNIPDLKKLLENFEDKYIMKLFSLIDDPHDIVDLIERAINDDTPPSVKDGNVIKDGFDPDIDGLREITRHTMETLLRMESEERQRTGIPSLKIGYNKIYGYYIEVTKPNLKQVPPDYERKQTLVNSERFVTQRLREFESRIITAEEELKRLEVQKFQMVVDELKKYHDIVRNISDSIAMIDLLVSFATIARRYNYCKPVVDQSGVIEMVDSRHPVLERLETDERFVPNDVFINNDDQRLLIITGPNMAGKSTYMRQVALCVIMAQMGSFVPARSARIGMIDRIFTRIGASDYLTKGLSTFMVEMVETANILNNATSQSLILLDEIGRGTSTFDGISIAWAVAEYIVNKIRARTFFATHYNELTELSLTLRGVKNYNVAVKEWGDEVIFLRKVEEGPADKSYGIQVARLAGLPEDVLERAKEVLANLEKSELDETGRTCFAGRRDEGMAQLNLFGLEMHPVLFELRNLDLKNISKDEALNILKELKKKTMKGG